METFGYTFDDPALLELALTHASADATHNNERLEFLGDTVLDLVIAEYLYRQTPELDEGTMTERKAWVVSRETLARIAHDLGMHRMARFGQGMRTREVPRSVLANLYEGYVGALYLDGGLEPARSFILDSLADALVEIGHGAETKNPKQELQHLAQTLTGKPPRYRLVEERGHAHTRAFLVAAEIEGRRFPGAWGRTRKEAERWAAFEALIVLRAEHAGEPER
ncbi:MAG TPA: ribonuclease III [Planctomycetes bacterium]|nr:ribonuclease III [Planctomycetota bacterium]